MLDARADEFQPNAHTLNVTQLSVARGNWRLCHGWSHQWQPGVHCILGDDGAGKTTLLQVLTGGLAPSMGAVTLQGMRVPSPGASIFWINPRAPQLGAASNAHQWVVDLPKHYPRWNETAWQQHVQGWTLAPMLHKPWEALSTGTARKIWMAAALASGATLVLIDEPIAGLDRPSIAYLRQALQAQCQQASDPHWLVVAHYDDMGVGSWNSVLQLETLPR